MSHAMLIYLKPENKEEYVELFYYGGSSNVYQLFRDEGLDCFCGDKGTNYKELTEENLRYILSSLDKDISKIKKQISIKEKLANGNVEIIDDIISSQEFVEELEQSNKDILFLLELVKMANWNGNKIYHNSY